MPSTAISIALSPGDGPALGNAMAAIGSGDPLEVTGFEAGAGVSPGAATPSPSPSPQEQEAASEQAPEFHPRLEGRKASSRERHVAIKG